MSDFDKYFDVIDSRDVIARIEELTREDEDQALSEEEKEELCALEALAAEASDSPDWKYGESLIRDSYFCEYAEQLAEDTAPFSPSSAEARLLDSWPYRCIDWEQAARELQQDYFTVDFDGVTYWIRD